MDKIIIINGPNLNLLGKREPEIYGSQTFEDFYNSLKTRFPEIELIYFQTNHEGSIIDKLQEVGFDINTGIILNAGGYTHTSIAIRDAIAGIDTPVFEVHISDIHSREDFRKHSYLTEKCVGFICGQGMEGYAMAIEELIKV